MSCDVGEVTAHSPTLPLLHLHHISFCNPSFASPTSQALHLRHLACRPWCVVVFLEVKFQYLNLEMETTCLVQLARLTAVQEVPGSILGYTLEIFLDVQGLERGPPSLVRTTGQLLDSIIIRVFWPRACNSLQTQEPRLQFCPKASLPLQTQEPRFQFYQG